MYGGGNENGTSSAYVVLTGRYSNAAVLSGFGPFTAMAFCYTHFLHDTW